MANLYARWQKKSIDEALKTRRVLLLSNGLGSSVPNARFLMPIIHPGRLVILIFFNPLRGWPAFVLPWVARCCEQPRAIELEPVPGFN